MRGGGLRGGGGRDTSSRPRIHGYVSNRCDRKSPTISIRGIAGATNWFFFYLSEEEPTVRARGISGADVNTSNAGRPLTLAPPYGQVRGRSTWISALCTFQWAIAASVCTIMNVTVVNAPLSVRPQYLYTYIDRHRYIRIYMCICKNNNNSKIFFHHWEVNKKTSTFYTHRR